MKRAVLGLVLACSACDLLVDVRSREVALCDSGQYSCVDRRRVLCSSEGDQYIDVPCSDAEPVCFSEGLCGLCDPGEIRCTSAGREECTASGAWDVETPLVEDQPNDCRRPICEEGAVVSAPDDADHFDMPGDCRTARCEDGELRTEPNAEDIPDDGDDCTTHYCDDGELRVALPEDEDAPCALAPGPSVHHTCARTGAGDVYCWGANEGGQLATDSVQSSSIPRRIEGLPPVRKVTVGGRFAHALDSEGAVYGWGGNDFGAAIGAFGPIVTSPTPVPLAAPALDVSSGRDHACAVLVDGTVHCWGKNVDGVLGDGSATTSFAPVRVADDTGLMDAIDVEAGGRVTCARTVARDLYCWGLASAVGARNDRLESVTKPLFVAADIREVRVSDEFACAITTDHTVICWGSRPADGFVTEPQEAFNGALALAVGKGHVCAALAEGMKCWGCRGVGHLGDGDTTRLCTVPSASAVTPLGIGTSPTSLAAHDEQSCAIVAAEIRCWGDNRFGKLGDGTEIDRFEPALVLWPK